MLASLKKTAAGTLCGVLLAAVATSSAAGASAADGPSWSVPFGGTTTVSTDENVTATVTRTSLPIACELHEGFWATAVSGGDLSGEGIVTVWGEGWYEETWGQCHGPFGLVYDLSIGGLPWSFNAVSYDAATKVVTGKVTGITASINGFNCSATFTGPNGAPGEVEATYDNNTGVATISGGNIVANTASNCSGLLAPGDEISLEGTFKAATRGLITSP